MLNENRIYELVTGFAIKYCSIGALICTYHSSGLNGQSSGSLPSVILPSDALGKSTGVIEEVRLCDKNFGLRYTVEILITRNFGSVLLSYSILYKIFVML